jgi:SWIB/MDM2 domain
MDIDDKFESIFKQFNTINDSLTLFKMQISTLQQQVKTVEKNVRKELKLYQKEKQKEQDKPKRQPSGFAKPTKVTKELCEFMGIPEGTEIARTEVNKSLANYIKGNNLIEWDEKEKKQKIVADQKLTDLLGIEDSEIGSLTYFNIQKYMNKHFVKEI